MRRKGLWVVWALAGLAACSSQADPGSAVESYLQAIIANDEIRAVDLSCAAWEAEARAEGRSFEGVQVSLEGLSCRAAREDGGAARVECSGQIVYSYGGGENKHLDLATRAFTVVEEGGIWRMCGYE